MPAVHEKTWQFDLNVAYSPASVADQAKWVFYQLKQHLLGNIALTAADGSAIGTGSIQGKWTCYGSSDSSTAGLDAVDRWGNSFDNTKIVSAAGGSPHSWIVLKSPSINGQFYYLTLSYNNANAHSPGLYLSTAAPTGGSASADPTQSGLWQTGSNYWYGQAICDTGGVSARKFHFMMTTEGHFFVAVTKDGQGYAQWHAFLLPIVNPVGRAVGGWPYPVVAGCSPEIASPNLAIASGPTGTYCLYNAGGGGRNAVLRKADNSGSVPVGLLFPAQYYANTLNSPTNWSAAVDTFGGDYPLFPAFIASIGIAPFTVAGRIPDFGVTWGGVTSGSVDDVADPRFQVTSNLLLPCPQTGPISY